MKLSFYILGFLLLASACSNKTDDTTSFDKEQEFYPLVVGKSWTYSIDSIIYDNEGRDVFERSALVKEEINEEFLNAEGERVFRIERFWKRNLEDLWQLTDVWSTSINDVQAIRTEDNLRFVKLVFPPVDGVRWDGNAFIDENTIVEISGESIEMFKYWDYRIISRIQNETVGNNTYDELVEVQLSNDENVIELRYAVEKYAKNVGLVFKEYRILDTKCIELCFSDTWEEKAQKGFILRQTLLEYK